MKQSTRDKVLAAMRRLIVLFAAVVLIVSTGARVATAQGVGLDQGSSYLTPFPEGDVYQLSVVGDGLADGLLGGIIDALGSDPRLQIIRRTRTTPPIARSDPDDELRQLEDQLGREQPVPQISVVMLGVQDRMPIRIAGGRRAAALGTPEWNAEYGRRIDRIIKAMKARGTAIYWVSLPVMRRPEWNADNEVINEVLRERTAQNGVRFIDVFTETGDEQGAYSPRGPDITGKSVQLRDSDGVGFTPAGNRKLAFFVERELKRDLTQARNERTVPLLGSEAEQARIAPERQSSAGSQQGTDEAGSVRPAPRPAGVAPARQTSSAAPESKAETSKITFKTQGADGRDETVTMDLVRPPIPQAVLSVVTRNQSPDKPSQVGETVTDTLPGGLVVMRSISSAALSGPRARLSPTELPFFRAMVRGERLPAKPGRADDMHWPRDEDATPPEPASQPQQAPAVIRLAPKGAPRVPGRS